MKPNWDFDGADSWCAFHKYLWMGILFILSEYENILIDALQRYLTVNIIVSRLFVRNMRSGGAVNM